MLRPVEVKNPPQATTSPFPNTSHAKKHREATYKGLSKTGRNSTAASTLKPVTHLKQK